MPVIVLYAASNRVIIGPRPMCQKAVSLYLGKIHYAGITLQKKCAAAFVAIAGPVYSGIRSIMIKSLLRWGLLNNRPMPDCGAIYLSRIKATIIKLTMVCCRKISNFRVSLDAKPVTARRAALIDQIKVVGALFTAGPTAVMITIAAEIIALKAATVRF